MFRKKKDKQQTTHHYESDTAEHEVQPLIMQNNIPIWQQLAQDAPKYESIDDTSVEVHYNATGAVSVDTNGYMEVGPADAPEYSDAHYEAIARGSDYRDVQPPDIGSLSISSGSPERSESTTAVVYSFGATAAESNLDSTIGLPPGWEEAKTKDGKTYYMNHVTQTTTWTRPSIGKPNIGDYIPLPAGWEFVPKPRPHFLDHNTKTSHNEDPRPLPDGWSQRVAQNGVAFFVDNDNKRTQWYHPCSQQQADAIEAKVDPNGKTYYLNHDTKESSWDNPLLRPGFFGARGSGLPPGCERRFTDDGRMYFIDHRTKTTTWTPPK